MIFTRTQNIAKTPYAEVGLFTLAGEKYGLIRGSTG